MYTYIFTYGNILKSSHPHKYIHIYICTSHSLVHKYIHQVYMYTCVKVYIYTEPINISSLYIHINYNSMHVIHVYRKLILRL